MNRRSFFATLAAAPAAAWAAIQPPKAIRLRPVFAPNAWAHNGQVEWPVSAGGLWERLEAWAQEQPGYAATGRLNTHEWNYGYSQDCGAAGPYPHDIGLGDGNGRITLAEYRTAMASCQFLDRVQYLREWNLVRHGDAYRKAYGS